MRNVEDLLHKRGTNICHETVTVLIVSVQPMFAAEIRKLRVEGVPPGHWRWHLDEVFVKIHGEPHDQ